MKEAYTYTHFSENSGGYDVARMYAMNSSEDSRYTVDLTLTTHPIIKNVARKLSDVLPEWDTITQRFEADKRRERDSGSRDNMTGALAEHVSRESILSLLMQEADGRNVFVHPSPMPDTVAQVDQYVFIVDPTSGNHLVINPYTNQDEAEYDGIFALETVNSSGESEVTIVVHESKAAIPRQPNNRKDGVGYVRKYLDKKLKPLRALFKDAKFCFLLTACKADSLSRSQQRFMRSLEKLGGTIAMLGVSRADVEAVAMSYL